MKNPIVVVLSLIALVCIVLTFFVSWVFVIPALIIFFLNNKLLKKK